MLFESAAAFVAQAVPRGFRYMIPFYVPTEAQEWEQIRRDMLIEPEVERNDCRFYLPDVGEGCWYCGKERDTHRADVLKVVGT